VQPKPATAVPTTFIHRVNEGETLSAIARWYTGKEDNWRRLAQVNPAIEPQRMRIGEQIHIPRDLLMRREPMPRIVQPVTPKKTPASAGSDTKKQPPPPTPRAIVEPRETPPVKGDVELFGPIESLPPSPPPSPPEDATDAPLELETLD
jgi:LysM repeat protein